jgi:hypothetical protein
MINIAAIDSSVRTIRLQNLDFILRTIRMASARNTKLRIKMRFYLYYLRANEFRYFYFGS